MRSPHITLAPNASSDPQRAGRTHLSSNRRPLILAVILVALILLMSGVSISLGQATATPTTNSASVAVSPIASAALASSLPDLPGSSLPADSITTPVLWPTASRSTNGMAENTGIPALTAAPTRSPVPTATPTQRPTPAPTAIPTTTALSPLPSWPVSVAGATVKRFSVSGSSPSGLSNSIISGATATCNTDSIGCFFDSYKWTYSTATDPSSGDCSVTSVDLTASYTVYLPDWDRPSSVPPALIPWFREALTHITWHESQHLSISENYAPQIKAAILAATCNGTQVAANAVFAKLTSAQNAFDQAQIGAGWTWPSYPGS